MKRTISIMTAVLFTAALAVPAFAQDASSAKAMKKLLKQVQKAATNSSLVAIDPGRRLAFVARRNLGGMSGDGLVDVINLKANPNKKDPRKLTIDLGHADFPIGVAVDVVNHVLLVASGHNSSGGKLDVIREKNFKPFPGSPFAYPSGSDTGNVGQLIFDPVRKKVIVATTIVPGFAVFDEITDTFGPIISAAKSDNFAFNALTNVVISPSDTLDPPIDAVDIGNGVGCLSDPADTNIQNQDDSDGAGFDPATNVVVVGDDGAPNVTAVNLNGSTFSDESILPCTLLEAGTKPNSVNITTSFDSPAGVAINLKTHQALIEQSGDTGIALVQLPTMPVTQIDSSTAFEISEATLPDDPSSSSSRIRGFPYSAAIDSKRNLGFGDVNDAFLLQISLKAFKNNPGAIGNGLPSGNCKGTSTTLGCSNGGGVTFFPLSDTTKE